MTERRFTGWHMLAVLLLFFGTVIGVNITLAVFAATSWTGLMTKDSYLAGQSYNEDLEKARAQNALGYQATFAIEPTGVGFTLLDAAGKPVIADAVAVNLGRPADDVDDHVVMLQSAGHGVYRADDNLAPGQWQADVRATLVDGTEWRRVWRLHLK